MATVGTLHKNEDFKFEIQILASTTSNETISDEQVDNSTKTIQRS